MTPEDGDSAPAPVARVCIDSPLPHLDRAFDYQVPPHLADVVQIGTRVRVRFAGRLVNAVVIEFGGTNGFDGRLTAINSAGAVPSYTPRALELAQQVARRYGGSLWDVLRVMAPARVASLESREWSQPSVDLAQYKDAAADLVTPVAPALDDAALAAGARVVWQALPDANSPSATPAHALAAGAIRAAAQGQSAIIITPDARAALAVESHLEAQGLRRWTVRGGGHVAVLDADDGANTRYASYLAAMHGHARIVVGTRQVALQPVPSLGFVALWDEPSPNYDEPHAPYFNARTVAAMRADFEGAGMLLAAYAPSPEALALAEHGWAERAVPPRAAVREAAAAIEVFSDEKRTAEGASGWHWMPGSVWRRAIDAVDRGPIAIVVPRAGYVRAVACAACGEWAQCRACAGTLKQDRAVAPLVCRDCAMEQTDWHCHECGSTRVKQLRQGVERIAEQVKAMAKGVDVHISSGATGTIADGVITAGIVVATPGAVPAVPGGYSMAVVIGAEAPASSGLGAEARAVRWWLSVAALVRARGAEGRVVLVGALPDAAKRALETWDPIGVADDGLAERAALGLPPTRRSVRLSGSPASITLALSVVVEGERLERHHEALVTPVKDGAIMLITRRAAQTIIDALRQRQVALSREGGDGFRMRVDGPIDV